MLIQIQNLFIFTPIICLFNDLEIFCIIWFGGTELKDNPISFYAGKLNLLPFLCLDLTYPRPMSFAINFNFATYKC